MRLAHLILAHDKPAQLERLVKRLAHPDADIFIHIDGKVEITPFTLLDLPEGAVFIKHRTPIRWADYSMMTATLTSFDEMMATGKTYSHLNLLSGHDYALKNPAVIHDFLFRHADKTFMRYRSIEDEWQESLSRFTKYHLGDYNFPLKFRLQWLMNKLLPHKKLPNGMKPYGFSQWLTVTPECATYVINFLKKHPNVKRFFRMTWGVDELVFQTILMNSPLKDKVVNDHLRYIKFVPRANNPLTLTMENADALVSSNKFYARKFNTEVDSRIFDYLDEAADKEIST
jgi:hypothetical protein